MLLLRRRLPSTSASLGLVLALLATLVVTPVRAASAAPARTSAEASAESHLVAEHNRVRAGASRGALRAASDLTEVARAWSDEMARTGDFRHNPSVSGQICCWSAWGENIAWAGPVDAIGGWRATADRIMRGWLDSPGHRDNLMSSTFNEVGIGVAVAANGRMYATAVFRRGDGSAAPAAPAARPVPEVRWIDRACPANRVPSAGFTDVGPSQARAVDCLGWWEVAQGTSARTFSPQRAVTRGQFAAFIHRAIEATGGTVQVARPRFSDLGGNVHATAIGELAAIGVVGGFADGTFRPNQTVTRAQMATMLVEAAEYRTGERLPAPSRDWFVDDSGTHERAVNQIADAGWAAGDGDGRFGASSTLQRGHLALFLARWLDTMVAEHGATTP